MTACGVLEALITALFAEPLQRRTDRRLRLGEAQHELLAGAHRVRQCRKVLGERHHRLVSLRPAVLAALQDALEVFHVLGGLLEQRLHIDRY
jgi:hypothetical protein